MFKWCSINKIPYLNSWIASYYNITCNTFIQLNYHYFSSQSSTHTDAAVLYCYRFKNSVMTEIRPLYLQPFTNSHFHFPIILESATCQVLLQWSELHYSFLCLSSEMMYMPHRLSSAYIHYDRILKLVPRWGECIKLFGVHDDKWWYFGGISDLHW